LSIPDPGSRISDPGSRIPDPKTATKERDEKKFVVLPFFVAKPQKSKIVNYIIINFELVKKKMWAKEL
jgi:hypothetical protein